MPGPEYIYGPRYDPDTGAPTYNPNNGLPTYCEFCVPTNLDEAGDWVFTASFTLSGCNDEYCANGEYDETWTYVGNDGNTWTWRNESETSTITFTHSDVYPCVWVLDIVQKAMSCWYGIQTGAPHSGIWASGDPFHRQDMLPPGGCSGPSTITVTVI